MRWELVSLEEISPIVAPCGWARRNISFAIQPLGSDECRGKSSTGEELTDWSRGTAVAPLLATLVQIPRSPFQAGGWDGWGHWSDLCFQKKPCFVWCLPPSSPLQPSAQHLAAQPCARLSCDHILLTLCGVIKHCHHDIKHHHHHPHHQHDKWLQLTSCLIKSATVVFSLPCRPNSGQ